MIKFIAGAIAAGTLFASPVVHAQTTADDSSEEPPQTTGNDTEQQEAGTPQPLRRNDDPLDRFGFGLSLALTFDTGANDRVVGASLDPNGIVRIDDQENVTGRFLLETHRFITPFSSEDIGIGPFIAVEAGSDPIIQAIGGGFMIGFKTGEGSNGRAATSFNIGVGIIYDLNTQILGEGIVANQPLPAGETVIRFRETEQRGVMILTSFSFY